MYRDNQKKEEDYGWDKEQAIDFMRTNPDVYLKKAAKHGYICPCCGSGDGPNGTGITETRPGTNKFSCFSSRQEVGGCFHGSDVIGIYAKAQGMTYGEAIYGLSDIYGIHIKGDHRDTDWTPQRKKPPADWKPPKPKEPEFTEEDKFAQEQIPKDIEESQKHRDPSNYLKKRGLSEKTQEHFHCGYLPQWAAPRIRYRKQQEGKRPFTTPRVIIPTGKDSYLARDVRPKEEIPEQYRGRGGKIKAGSHAQFNWDIAKKKNGIFITEGEIDAMSIYEAGQKNVLALGSTSNVKRFVKYLEDNHIKGRAFYVCLDTDEPGRVASKAFIQALKESGNLGIDASSIILEGTKDANESLVADRNRFVIGLAKSVRMLNTIARRASASR